jgi:hypothetical protein
MHQDYKLLEKSIELRWAKRLKYLWNQNNINFTRNLFLVRYCVQGTRKQIARISPIRPHFQNCGKSREKIQTQRDWPHILRDNLVNGRLRLQIIDYCNFSL